VAAGAAPRRVEQALALVVAQRLDVDPGRPCQLHLGYYPLSSSIIREYHPRSAGQDKSSTTSANWR
jgi:hypothetical protein